MFFFQESMYRLKYDTKKCSNQAVMNIEMKVIITHWKRTKYINDLYCFPCDQERIIKFTLTLILPWKKRQLISDDNVKLLAM